MKTLIIPGTELCPMKWKKILFNIHDPHPPNYCLNSQNFIYIHIQLGHWYRGYLCL